MMGSETTAVSAWTHNVGIGALVVAEAPDKLRTVLGSCVGIALYDRRRRLAGLAHVILPEGNSESAELGKFADQAVDNLIVQLAAMGASKTRLQAKLVGGAAMFGAENNNGLGDRNVEVARNRLAQHGIPVLAEAVGGTKGRKLFVDPDSGEAMVEIIGQKREVI